MTELNVHISDEAATFILEALRLGESHPEVTGLPALTRVLGSQTYDEEGRPVVMCPKPFFAFGYQRPEAARGYIPVNVRGRTVWVSRDAMRHLKGKTLIVETFEVEAKMLRPNKTVRVLRTV